MASSSSTQKTQITVSGGVSTKGKAKKGGGAAVAGKKPGRGMGVAQLERIRVQESWKMINDLNPVPLQTGFGVPVRCGEVYAAAGAGTGTGTGAAPNGYFAPAGPGFLHGTPVGPVRIFRPEPTIPDPASWSHFDFSNLTFKKKRVMNGEDFEHKCYQGVEILAVHRKGVGTRNMVMEYGFFPASSPASTKPASTPPSASAPVCPSKSPIDLSLKL